MRIEIGVPYFFKVRILEVVSWWGHWGHWGHWGGEIEIGVPYFFKIRILEVARWGAGEQVSR